MSDTTRKSAMIFSSTHAEKRCGPRIEDPEKIWIESMIFSFNKTPNYHE
ncbi:MAG: hypothetical protein ACSHX0_13855 [Akkermansiaceae bacterium]